MSWYDFCVAYVDMKWKSASGKHRANIAWALVTVMPAMLATDNSKVAEKKVRTALRKWAFNTKNRAECPEDAAEILKWLARSTKPVSALADPKAMRAVLDRAATLLDGSRAAPSTIQRNRAILHNACEYAVELNMLTRNPIKAIKWKAPKASPEVDRRSVVNHGQARRLLQAVRTQQPSGPRLAAFFAVLYYAAYVRRKPSTCAERTSPFRRWSGTTKRRAGRNRRTTGESCTSVPPRPRSERSGPMTAPAAKCDA